MSEILVVEDDPETNDAIAGLLRSIADTRVTCVHSRPEAHELIVKNTYDLAVIDLDLGPENGVPGRFAGISLIPELAKKDVVTIVVSGLTEEAMPEVVLALKAFDFVSKPFRTHDFLNKVNNALKLRKANAANEGDQLTEVAHRSELQKDPDNNPGFLWRGKPVRLTITQYRLVNKLIRTPGAEVTFASLAEAMGTATSKGALATHFTGIRKRFVDVDPKFKALISAPGRGYVWQEGLE